MAWSIVEKQDNIPPSVLLSSVEGLDYSNHLLWLHPRLQICKVITSSRTTLIMELSETSRRFTFANNDQWLFFSSCVNKECNSYSLFCLFSAPTSFLWGTFRATLTRKPPTHTYSRYPVGHIPGWVLWLSPSSCKQYHHLHRLPYWLRFFVWGCADFSISLTSHLKPWILSGVVFLSWLFSPAGGWCI